jgi:hypothetical protein
MGDDTAELTPTERAFVLGLLIGQGRTFTAVQVAAAFQMTESGAYRLLNRVARRAHIYSDEGVWQSIEVEGRKLLY